MSIAVARRYEGEIREVPSLRPAKLIGGSPSSHLSDLFTGPCPAPDGRYRDRVAADRPTRARDHPE
ncbi:MAG: hypothetical protein M3Y33_17425 [Actinomycetota bacterium]|nr:hypothetical protein [Actinomycetota bacterium]